MRRRFAPISVFVLFLVLSAPQTALAVADLQPRIDTTCAFNPILKSYALGLKAYRAREFILAKELWSALSHRGFQPAARWKAVLYANGRGLKQDLVEAAFWAEVAAFGKDKEAQNIKKLLAKQLTKEQRQSVAERLKAWKPKTDDCWGAPVRPVRNDAHSFTTRQGIKVLADPRLPKASVDLAFRRFGDLIDMARTAIPMASLYLLAVERAEIHVGDRYDRFMRFKPGIKGHVLQISVGTFFDKQLDYAAKGIAYEAYRHIYARLGNSAFDDPYVITYKGKRLVGSVYPDADNAEFFKVMKRVTKLAQRLPEGLQNPFTVVDEIRYTPHSRIFEKRGLLDGGVAYYNRQWSYPGNRMIFLRRDLRFSSDADMLLTVVHEGTHVAQDIRSEAYETDIPEKRVALQDLEASGRGDQAGVKALRASITDMEDYVRRWRRGVPKGDRMVQDITFECEATMTEINVAKSIGAPPRLVEKSQYLAVCDQAKIALVRWKDSLITRSIR